MKLEHIHHAVKSHAQGFAMSHPWMTFFLAAMGIATVGKGVVNVLGQKSSAAQAPNPNAGV